VTSTIEVFADIWCPFADVGLRALVDHRRRRGREDVVIRVRAWPLELVNAGPMDPVKTLGHVEHLREQVAPTMFRDVAVSPFPTSTIDALALVERAYDVDERLGERASFEVRDAMFEVGRDISDPDVLEDLAKSWDVGSVTDADRALVVRSWRDGQARGVRGSPHFFCGERESFCPSLQITNDPEVGVRIERDAQRLSDFLDACLAS
jgi:predicted DsbA family dithiol-disulfide isomerase